MTRLLAVFALLAFSLSAQNFRGGIKGSVTDESGSVLVNAVVKATNEGTGLPYSTLSSTAGEFTFQDLPLGQYSIEVTLPGFEVVRISRVGVSAGTVFNLPVKLPIARVSSTVEVSAAAVSVDTNTGSANQRSAHKDGTGSTRKRPELHGDDCARAGVRWLWRQRIVQWTPVRPGQSTDRGHRQ